MALPPAWAVVSSSAKADFRVLWMGADTGTRFVAPGGDPEGDPAERRLVPAIRPDGTGRHLATDTGRALTGPGEGYLVRALSEIVSGSTTHGGALLAPLGVRFVVAQRDDLPPDIASIFAAQVDLDREGTSGLLIYPQRRGDPARGGAARRRCGRSDRGIGGPRCDRTTAVVPPSPLVRRFPEDGRVEASAPGLALVSTEFEPAWRLDASNGDVVTPDRGVRLVDGLRRSCRIAPRPVRRQWIRTWETIVLGLLWLVALWVTRKPVAR